MARAEPSRLAPCLQEKHAIRLQQASQSTPTLLKISKEKRDSLVVTICSATPRWEEEGSGKPNHHQGRGELGGADLQAPRSHIPSPALVADKSNLMPPRIWRGSFLDEQRIREWRLERQHSWVAKCYEQLCALANRRQIPFIKKGAFFLPLLFDSLVKRRIAEKCERWEDGQGIVDTVETRDTHGPRDLCSPFFLKKNKSWA